MEPAGKNLIATPWLFLAPFLLLFGLFMLLPAVAGVGISLTEWDILGTPEFIGLENYIHIFGDPLFWRSIFNTFAFMLMTSVPLVVFGLALALLLNQKLRGTTIVRTIVFLPHVLMVSAVGVLWTWMYESSVGLINHYLRLVGLPAPNWLTDTDTAMPAIAVTTIWWIVNVNMMIYLTALQDIPAELYDASKVDGATAWQRFRYITLPLLMPVTAMVTALTIVGGWRVFGQAYVMTRGGPEASTFVIVQYIYLTAFQNFEMGPAAAAGVVLLFITLAFSLVQLRLMRSRKD
jgi:multiple sugar transport system permease protein